jgi:type III restriction enzyme
MTKIVQHIWEAIREGNTERLTAVFDGQYPIRSTADMRTCYTGGPCEYCKRSHINFCVYDTTWEASEAFILDRDPKVEAWVKNDHLGFEVLYVFKGVVKKYRPDFLIRLTSGKMLVLEIKGQDTQQDQSKRHFLGEWCKAVNSQGGFEANEDGCRAPRIRVGARRGGGALVRWMAKRAWPGSVPGSLQMGNLGQNQSRGK